MPSERAQPGRSKEEMGGERAGGARRGVASVAWRARPWDVRTHEMSNIYPPCISANRASTSVHVSQKNMKKAYTGRPRCQFQIPTSRSLQARTSAIGALSSPPLLSSRAPSSFASSTCSSFWSHGEQFVFDCSAPGSRGRSNEVFLVDFLHG